MLETVEQAGGMHHSLHPRNNSDPTGNRHLTARKPATESTCAQGKQEVEEVLFSDQKL